MTHFETFILVVFLAHTLIVWLVVYSMTTAADRKLEGWVAALLQHKHDNDAHDLLDVSCAIDTLETKHDLLATCLEVEFKKAEAKSEHYVRKQKLPFVD